MYLIIVVQVQKPFLLLAPFSLLRSRYCYSDLLGPSLWSRFFSWASAWNSDHTVWPLGKPASPCPFFFPHVRKLSTQSTELLSQLPLPSHLPPAQSHSLLCPVPWPVPLTPPLSKMRGLLSARHWDTVTSTCTFCSRLLSSPSDSCQSLLHPEVNLLSSQQKCPSFIQY